MGVPHEIEKHSKEEKMEPKTKLACALLAVLFLIVLGFAKGLPFSNESSELEDLTLSSVPFLPSPPPSISPSPTPLSSTSQDVVDAKRIFQAYIDCYPKGKLAVRILPEKPATVKSFEEQLAKHETDNDIQLRDTHIHREAFARVWKILHKLQRGENVTIAAVGGSPTAMGRYMFFVANFFKKFRYPGHVITVKMGHGSQNSNHAMFLLDEFLPTDVDMVIWEFSINDMAGKGNAYRNLPVKERKNLAYASKRNLLHMIGNVPSRPVVLLVHLWGPEGSKKFDKHVWDHKSFPYLLGSVNLGTFRAKFGHRSDPLFEKFVMWDGMHPSADGHRALGELLKRAIARALLISFSLQRGDGQSEKGLPVALKPFKTTCFPAETKQKEFQDFLDFAAQTAELPRSWSLLIPRLETTFTRAKENVTDYIRTSKASPTRNDRRYVQMVPPCGSTNETMVFFDNTERLANAGPSRYFALSSDKEPLQGLFLPTKNFDVLEFTLCDAEDQQCKVLKKKPVTKPTQKPNRKKWMLDDKEIVTIRGQNDRFMCGLQAGLVFNVDVAFAIAKVSVCASEQGAMTLQWFSVLA